MAQSNRKITRRHSRQKSGTGPDPKGERFYLQGKRWRFPRGLPPHEVEARIVRLRSLWEDHERFWRNRYFIDPYAYAPETEDLLEFKAEAYRRQQQGGGSSLSSNRETSASHEISWTPLLELLPKVVFG